MSTRNLTCIGCPMGCQLTAELAGGEVVSVRGNTCARGEAYAPQGVHPPGADGDGDGALRGRRAPGRVRPDGGRGAEGERSSTWRGRLGAVTVRAPLHIGDVVLADAAAAGVAGRRDEEVAES